MRGRAGGLWANAGLTPRAKHPRPIFAEDSAQPSTTAGKSPGRSRASVCDVQSGGSSSSRPPARRRRKKGGADRAIALSRGGLTVIAAIESSGTGARIPGHGNVRRVRTVDREFYRERNRIVQSFNRIRHFRGTAMRCIRTAGNFLAALHLACAKPWIRHHESMTQALGKVPCPGRCSPRQHSR